jgi:PPK2 family polyphosphate:nucleotide phosphotransferase
MAKKIKGSFINDSRVVVNKRGSFKLKHYTSDIDTDLVKKDLKELLDKDREHIADMQDVLYASGARAVLLIFQAMDAAGKDSCVRHVMSGVNPQGVQVTSFKAPTALERSHDFLWRHAQALPPRGFIGIHNRSHYEEVLVTRVHPEIIVGQHLPGITTVKDIGRKFWEQRYDAIRNFEEHLAANGTVIMKFFLYMSREQQKKRFLERIDDADKNWKFSANDVKERAYWKDYMAAYEEAIRETAAPHAPWFIIPADEQWESRALVGRLLREQLQQLGLKHPQLDNATLGGLKAAKAMLLKERPRN